MLVWPSVEMPFIARITPHASAFSVMGWAVGVLEGCCELRYTWSCVWDCQMALCLVVTGSPWTCQPIDQGWFAALTCPGTVRELIIAFWHWAFPDYKGGMNFLLIKAQSLIFDCFHFESNCCKLCRWQGIFYWCLPQQRGLFTLQPGAVIQVSYLLAGKCSSVITWKKLWVWTELNK